MIIPSLFSTRAQSFHSLSGSDLAAWMNSIGLEMYSELISQLVVTGERLASIAANTEDLVVSTKTMHVEFIHVHVYICNYCVPCTYTYTVNPLIITCH